MPVLAAADPRAVAPNGLVREFSSINQIPPDLERVPAPSRVHERPQLPA